MTGFTRLYFYISSILLVRHRMLSRYEGGTKREIFNPLSAEMLIFSNIARLSSCALMLLSMIWITKQLK